MAARTLLMDIKKQGWSSALCRIFDVPLNILPQIQPSAQMNLQLANGLILQASLGDQSAAFIASIAENSAEALVNLGTGGFVIRSLSASMNSADGYLRTLIYQDINLHAHIAIEGTLNSIAAALAPYSAEACRIEEMDEMEKNDIFCLAEPSGIGAPYFRNNLGLCFSESIIHLAPHQIATLLLQGIIFRVARILEDFHRTAVLERVYLSGGLSELAYLQQGIAQCVPLDVYRLQQKDSSLQGAALLAAGMEAAHNRQSERIVLAHSRKSLQGKYQRWKVWLDTLLSG